MYTELLTFVLSVLVILLLRAVALQVRFPFAGAPAARYTAAELRFLWLAPSVAPVR